MRAQKRAEAAVQQKLLEKLPAEGIISLNLHESWLYALLRDFVFAATSCCCYGGNIYVKILLVFHFFLSRIITKYRRRVLYVGPILYDPLSSYLE